MRKQRKREGDESGVKKSNTQYDTYSSSNNSTTITILFRNKTYNERNVLYLKKACSLSSVASLSPDPSLSRGSLISSLRNRFFAS